METIVIATIKDWNISNFFILKKRYKNKFNFILINRKNELTYKNLCTLSPKYILFPHWSWIIPKEIYQNFECIVFHMTDLPFGRGGSPMQNLILQKTYSTKITAIKADEGIDSGDIYLKEDFDLSTGNAQKLFLDISNLIFKVMIPKLLEEQIAPKRQEGEITSFKRRTPSQSALLEAQINTLRDLYDFIRMLDAPGYPHAFIQIGRFKLELKNADLIKNTIRGEFEVKLYE